MKITNQIALGLRMAYAALDGTDRIVDLNGQQQIVKKPYRFSGKTRLNIARNLRALGNACADYEAARIGLVLELAEGGAVVPTDKVPAYNIRHFELLTERVEVALTAISEDEFNTEQNEIPPTVLAELLPYAVPAFVEVPESRTEEI